MESARSEKKTARKTHSIYQAQRETCRIRKIHVRRLKAAWLIMTRALGFNKQVRKQAEDLAQSRSRRQTRRNHRLNEAAAQIKMSDGRSGGFTSFEAKRSFKFWNLDVTRYSVHYANGLRIQWLCRLTVFECPVEGMEHTRTLLQQLSHGLHIEEHPLSPPTGRMERETRLPAFRTSCPAEPRSEHRWLAPGIRRKVLPTPLLKVFVIELQLVGLIQL